LLGVLQQSLSVGQVPVGLVQLEKERKGKKTRGRGMMRMVSWKKERKKSDKRKVSWKQREGKERKGPVEDGKRLLLRGAAKPSVM